MIPNWQQSITSDVTAPSPLFSIEDADAVNVFALREMLVANAGDDELCAWLFCADVGECFRTGGATGESVVERII